MDVFEAIKGRRSIRKYESKEVSEEEIRRILDAAIHAPSAGNIQPWSFILVKSPSKRRDLARVAYGQMFIAEAPLVIVVCADERASGWGYGSRGRSLYCIQDTAAAIQNILLAAHAMGLGSCWVGAFNEDAAREVVKTPPEVRPIALIPIGHPAEKPYATGRKTLNSVVHWEKYG
ncbi:MAG: nitroreductase family protein [Candidatus Hodarchaeota archaeon]